jgi:hypothetical protein
MPLLRTSRQGLAALTAGCVLILSAIPVFASSTPTPGKTGPGTVAITVRTCAAAYDPAADGADPGKDCKEQAGDTNFIVSHNGTRGPSASTGTSGSSPQNSTVTFSELAAGRYTITAEAPAEIAGAFIAACSRDVRSLASPLVPFATVKEDGTVTLDLLPGETLGCDWYQVAKAS